MAETNLAFFLRNVENVRVRQVGFRFLQLFILIACVVGATTSSGSAWALGDVGVGLMAWLNIIAILILQQPAFKILRDFERQRKLGKDPVFRPSEAGIANADLWEEIADNWERGTPGKNPAEEAQLPDSK